jgi:hypothetical protein
MLSPEGLSSLGGQARADPLAAIMKKRTAATNAVPNARRALWMVFTLASDTRSDTAPSRNY